MLRALDTITRRNVCCTPGKSCLSLDSPPLIANQGSACMPLEGSRFAIRPHHHSAALPGHPPFHWCWPLCCSPPATCACRCSRTQNGTALTTATVHPACMLPAHHKAAKTQVEKHCRLGLVPRVVGAGTTKLLELVIMTSNRHRNTCTRLCLSTLRTSPMHAPNS